MVILALIIAGFMLIVFIPSMIVHVIAFLVSSSDSIPDHYRSYDDKIKYYRDIYTQHFAFLGSTVGVIGCIFSFKNGGIIHPFYGVLLTGAVSGLILMINDGLSESLARKKVDKAQATIDAHDRRIEERQRQQTLDQDNKAAALKREREETQALARAEEELTRQREEEAKRAEENARKIETEKLNKERTEKNKQLKHAENFFFDFFNNVGFEIEFVDDPNDENKGFPEIRWTFSSSPTSGNALVPINQKNAFNGFLKRQEFSIHIYKNKGKMFRNARELTRSTALEIYTHRRIENYRFIDKEADMNETMNYYVFISLRVDNIDIDGNKPVARIEEYDWSLMPTSSTSQQFAYYEFDSHRITREEHLDKVARKRQQVEEKQELSRLEEIEKDLGSDSGDIISQIKKHTEQFKAGSLKHGRALEDILQKIIQDEMDAGMDEDTAEQLYETLKARFGK